MVRVFVESSQSEVIEFDRVALERWQGGVRYELRLAGVAFKYSRPDLDRFRETLSDGLKRLPRARRYEIKPGEHRSFTFTRGAVEQLESVIRRLTVDFLRRPGEESIGAIGGRQ
jgi:hypothetical protein